MSQFGIRPAIITPRLNIRASARRCIGRPLEISPKGAPNAAKHASPLPGPSRNSLDTTLAGAITPSSILQFIIGRTLTALARINAIVPRSVALYRRDRRVSQGVL